ncbi:hypothetical protein [Noviherbaspirillum denitrificans]|uniref:MFS transporter n=1 Tax=Noviherbaspirillum denitrificans TaxID=1968433 RepID=A0A254TPL9_9BURK|nr:hypothetical protein [Noviherbaspirillum denitrificans]OWW22583.1 hypothetical protein AYR66_26860 [Noviherbaspirillum denitrificans]
MQSHQRNLLPLCALQGAVGSFGGFIGFFVIGAHDLHALFRYTACMLTAAMASTFLAYLLSPRLHIGGAGLVRLGLLVPGLLLLTADGSVALTAIAFGAYLGITWTGRHALEMSLLADAERDAYAARSGTAMIVLSFSATLASTLLLASFSEQSRYVYWLYGALCLFGALFLGKAIPRTEPVTLKDPLAVIRQPRFIACMPIFFLESGLFGISQAMTATGASSALGVASHYGWVTTAAGLAGGAALYMTRKMRNKDNRAHWFGGACLAMSASWLLLGASAWIPLLYIVHSVARAAGSPFLAASQQVLNQCTLDIRGTLADRIFARELVLWMLRMTALFLFWGLALVLTPRQLFLAGAAFLAAAMATEYAIGKALFRDSANANANALQAA